MVGLSAWSGPPTEELDTPGYIDWSEVTAITWRRGDL